MSVFVAAAAPADTLVVSLVALCLAGLFVIFDTKGKRCLLACLNVALLACMLCLFRKFLFVLFILTVLSALFVF